MLAGWKLPFGVSTSIGSPIVQTLRQELRHRSARLYAHAELELGRAGQAHDRIGSALLLPVEHGPERHVLAGRVAEVRAKLLRDGEREPYGVLGRRRAARQPEWVKLQHAQSEIRLRARLGAPNLALSQISRAKYPGQPFRTSVALEAVEGLEAALAAIKRLAGRRAELAQAARRTSIRSEDRRAPGRLRAGRCRTRGASDAPRR